MKINCEYCNKDLRASVSKSLEQFEVGKVVCPHCNKENKRYLSESDLLLYFGGMIVIYCAGLIVSFQIWNSFNFTIALMIIIAILVLAYFLSKTLIEKIYINGIFKSDYKTHIFKEDMQAVKKNLKRQFILFLLVALMFGSQPNMVFFAMLLIVVFFIITAIKCRYSLKNERAIVNSSKHKTK